QNDFSGNQPGASPNWQAYWSSLSYVPSPVTSGYITPIPSGGTSPTGNYRSSVNELSLDCQYSSISNSMTDGCIGYEGEVSQEETGVNRVKITNATIAGIALLNNFVQNSGPYMSGEIEYTSRGSNNQQAACKVS